MEEYSYTRKLAEFAISSNSQMWDDESIRLCKTSLEDYIAVAFSGCREEPTKILLSLMQEEGYNEQCTIIGTGVKGSCLWSPLINGTSAHVHDFDDVHDHLPIHLNVTSCSAALAVAEYVHASGKDLITAILNGMQVSISVANCVYLNHYKAGWHGSATMGIWGAAAAAGYLLHLTVDEMCNAFGFVASNLCGVQKNFGTMTKSYHLGYAARQGIMAAMLAKKGFTANAAIMDTDFFETISTKVDKDKMIRRLYGLPAIKEMKYKSYPCVVRTHCGIIGAHRLMNKYDINIDDIAAIEQESDSYSDHIVGVRFPQKGLEGKFSATFCVVASILFDGKVELNTFSDDIVVRPDVVELLKKTTLVANTEFDGTRNGRTIIYMKDGTKYEETVMMFGPEYDVASRVAQVKEKYLIYAGAELPSDQAERSLSVLESIESLGDVAELMQTITK